MTTNDLLQLLATATPGPWRRPIPDNHVGRIVSPSAPATPPKATVVAEHDPWHRCLAIARNDALADAIIALRTHLDTLTSGDIAPSDWDNVRHAVRGAIGPSGMTNDSLRLELARVTSGPDDHGRYEVACPAEVEGQPLKRRTIVTVGHADGSDAGDDANLIAGLLSRAVGLLSSAMARVVALRQIGPTIAVLDASYAKEFDAHDWADDGGQIIERKTGLALGDMLLGLDGLWATAPAQTSDGFLLPKGALDYRRHRLIVSNRARSTTIVVPPEILARLSAAAAEFGGNVGRAIASRFA